MYVVFWVDILQDGYYNRLITGRQGHPLHAQGDRDSLDAGLQSGHGIQPGASAAEYMGI